MHSFLSRIRTWHMVVLLAVIVTAVFARSLGNEFVNWDDNSLIFKNEMVINPSWDGVKKAFTSYDPELYIPLTFLSYQAESALFGLNPTVFHATNIVLHVLNTILVFLFILLLTRSRGVAFFCALFFGIHPLQTEAVAWAAARKDLLSSFFFLATLVAYYAARLNGSRGWMLGALGFFLLGLLSKVSIVPIPFILLLIDWKEGWLHSYKDVLKKWGFFLLALAFIGIAIYGKSKFGNIQSLPLWDRMLLSAMSTVFYLHKLILPADFSVMYQYTQTVSIFSADFYLPVLILILLIGLVVASVRYTKMIAFGSLFFMLLLAPSFATFWKVGLIFFASDRYAYLPSIGFFLILTWGIHELFRRRTWKIQLLPFAGGIFACIFALLTYAQVGTWKNTEAIYRQVVRAYPNSMIGQLNLGSILEDKGNLDQAIIHYKKAVEIDPNHILANSNLGAAYGKRGDYEKGVAYLQKAQELRTQQ